MGCTCPYEPADYELALEQQRRLDLSGTSRSESYSKRQSRPPEAGFSVSPTPVFCSRGASFTFRWIWGTSQAVSGTADTCGIKWYPLSRCRASGALAGLFSNRAASELPLAPRASRRLACLASTASLGKSWVFSPLVSHSRVWRGQVQVQEMRRGLDEALSGQVARPPEPKRVIPRIVLAPEFWSPSPSQSDFIRKLRETETTNLPSADTPYPEADPGALSYRSKNPPLSPERTIAYVALADPAPGTSLEQRCEQTRAEIEAESARIEKNGAPQGRETVAAACVNVWARHEGARLAGMLDPKSDVYQQRLAPARGEGARGNGSADRRAAQGANPDAAPSSAPRRECH